LIDPQVLLDKLGSFSTPDEVAQYLEGQGIVGDLRKGSTCPVSKYTTQNGANYVYTSRRSMLTDRKIYNLPEVVSKFVEKFDEGHYPNLVKEDPCR
jgi:hypothetical protein